MDNLDKNIKRKIKNIHIYGADLGDANLREADLTGDLI